MVIRRAVAMLVCAVVGLVLVPVMLVVAGLVRWRLGSPVLFRQTRVGARGREFRIV
jgi:lipopolysaccharide/colanic/teichoic acid biosynthesis glycosyltransferase